MNTIKNIAAVVLAIPVAIVMFVIASIMSVLPLIIGIGALMFLYQLFT